MHQGTVKWFDESRGYGFIAPDEGGPDVFVHATEVRKAALDLAEGDRVAFEIEKGRNGKPCAVRLQG